MYRSYYLHVTVLSCGAVLIGSLHQFQGDVIAGITVGLTVIPQSLAYAKIAELPPQVDFILTP